MLLTSRMTSLAMTALLLLISARGDAVELDKLLEQVKTVGPNGKGSPAAAAAWEKLSQAEAAQIPQVLAALDDANPLAANWIRGAVDAIAERELEADGKLPADALEKFVLETKHNPRARRLAYELLLSADESAESRLLPKLMHDPSVELRRDAVDRQLKRAETISNRPQAVKLYKVAFDAAVDDDQVKAAAAKLKDFGEEIDIAGHYGFLLKWHIVGPFDNADEKGYAIAYPPEAQAVDVAAKYPGSHDQGEVGWKEVVSDDDYGRVDLNESLAKHKSAVAYAANFFESDKAQPVEIRWKSKNAGKVWLNGKLIDAREVYHSDGSPALDQYICAGELKNGRNTIVIKICQNDQSESWAQGWAFQLRVCDAAGAAVLATNR